METTLLLGILVGALVLFMSEVVRTEVTALAILAALSLTGILTVEQALSGFSSPATITVAAMLVMSAGLTRAGVADYASVMLERFTGSAWWMILLALGLTVGFFSAFMNNTAVVAITIPIVLTLCQRKNHPPSKFLLPVSYFAIMGGTCTLVGTSTNIIVDSISRAHGGPSFHMFEFTGLGLVVLVIGMGCIVLLVPLLPIRTPLSLILSPRARSQFVTEIAIPSGSRFEGRAIGEISKEIRVLELFRNEESILKPDPELLVASGDAYLVEGSARAIRNLMASSEVAPATAIADEERVAVRQVDVTVTELVIMPNSRFVGQRMKDIGLRRRYGVLVLAARRLGVGRHSYGLRMMGLRPGDVLLVQGSLDSLHALQESGDVLLVEGVERTMTFPHRAPCALAILGGVVLLAALDVAPLAPLSIVGVALMLVTRCLPMAEATRALDSSVLLLLAGTIPLGVAMAETGVASQLGHGMVDIAGDNPLVMVTVFYVVTSILTEIVSNNATAALLTPVALAIAAEMGINPKAMLMAVVFGASSSFATPIGYQTNAMVMGAGGYLFRDYLRFGLPLKIVFWIVVSALIPVLWPLTGS